MTEESKLDIDKMVVRERKVTITGESFIVKPFTVRDLIFFSRELVEAAKVVNDAYPNLDFKKTNPLKYLPLLIDEVPRLIGLMARSIGKDEEWLSSQTDLTGFSELFTAICELNDFGVVIANFQRGWSVLQSQKINIASPKQ